MTILMALLPLSAIGWVVFDALRNWKAAGNDPDKNDALEFLAYCRGSTTYAWGQAKIVFGAAIALAVQYVDLVASPEVTAAIQQLVTTERAATILALIGVVTLVLRSRNLPPRV